MDSDVEYYYNDALRWTFGFDNPNKAAVIFACLFPLTWLLWSLAWKIKSPWIRWPGILLTSGMILANAFCLFKTYLAAGWLLRLREDCICSGKATALIPVGLKAFIPGKPTAEVFWESF